MRLTTSAAELASRMMRSAVILRALEVRRFGRQPAVAGVGIGDDRGQRLVHLVRDRSRKLGQARGLCRLGELVGGLSQRLLGAQLCRFRTLAFGQIENVGDPLPGLAPRSRQPRSARGTRLPSFLKNSFSRACILPVVASSSASSRACTSCHSGGVISNHRSPACKSSRSHWTMRRNASLASISPSRPGPR